MTSTVSVFQFHRWRQCNLGKRILLAGEEPMVAIPLVLPMGWVQSPPYFSTTTETRADIMNWRLRSEDETLPKHRLEDLVLESEPEEATTTEEQDDSSVLTTTPTTTAPTSIIHPPRYRKRMRYAAIYVNDFIAILQGNAKQRCYAIMRILLHMLDDILHPLEPGDGPH